MHTPGHNPYISSIDPYSFTYGPDYWFEDYHDFSLPGYEYSGINQTIMEALSNVMGGGYAGSIFDISQMPGIDLGDFRTFENENIDDIEIYWGEDGQMELHMSPDNKAGMTTHYGQEMQDVQTYFTPESPYDPSMGALPFVNVFDPESLALGLSAVTGYDDSILASEVRALNPAMLEKTEGQYYEPLEQAKRSDLVEDKVKELSRVATGGFAGSAGRQAGLSGAERLYRGGYEDLIAQIEKMKGSATEDVLDTIYSWQELMSGVQG